MFRDHNSVFVVAFAIIAAMFVAACTCNDTADESTPPPDTREPVATDEEALDYLTAEMRVVTLAGNPLPGMMPIATLKPNAFDPPVATGPATDADGRSRIRFPADKQVALRAWDDTLLYFPNNFYEVLPKTGVVRDTLVISMVESASIEAVLIDRHGEPVKNENAGLMLFHPVHGPWWPAEANTNADGAVTFYRVPPGQYVLRIKIASGPVTDVPETFIPPGESAHIGRIHFE